MPLNRNAPRDGMEQTYAAMRICTPAKYDGVSLDDYADTTEEADE